MASLFNSVIVLIENLTFHRIIQKTIRGSFSSTVIIEFSKVKSVSKVKKLKYTGWLKRNIKVVLLRLSGRENLIVLKSSLKTHNKVIYLPLSSANCEN